MPPPSAGLPTGELEALARRAGLRDFRLLPERQDRPAYLVAALPYPLGVAGDPGAGPSGPPPSASIGRFARSHWYRLLAQRLMSLAAGIRAALPGFRRSDFRVLVNSRATDERRLALAAGLGLRGHHGLVISHASGCACVLGALELPSGILISRMERKEEPNQLRGAAARSGLDGLHPACAGCGACAAACPTGAIGRRGGVDTRSCIQAWASREGEVPPAVARAWGDILYGCDACIMACPLRGGDESAEGPGAIGLGLSIPFVLATEGPELKKHLRDTALGLSWLSPDIIKRNACLAARCRLEDYPSLVALLERVKKNDPPWLGAAAAWSLDDRDV